MQQHNSPNQSASKSLFSQGFRNRSNTNYQIDATHTQYLAAPKQFIQSLNRNKQLSQEHYGLMIKNIINHEYQSIEMNHNEQLRIKQNKENLESQELNVLSQKQSEYETEM